MTVAKYDDLLVWQRSMDLVREVYEVTRPFPNEERFGLAGQLRRSAISVASNIAEGQGRASTSEFLHHLSFAYGSLIEVETQARIAAMLGYLLPHRFESLLAKTSEVGRMLNGLRKSLAVRLRVVERH